MNTLLQSIRIVGWWPMLRLLQAYRLSWPNLLGGFYTTRMLQTLQNVGFFAEIQRSGRIDVEQFAAERRLDACILRSICEALFALRYLKRDGEGYQLDRRGMLFAAEAQGWFEGVYGYEEVFHKLEALLRGEIVYGRDIYRRPDFVARGSGEIEKKIFFPLAEEVIRRNNYRHVLDLGCGDATFLRYLCTRNQDLCGFGVDIAPAAIAEGRDHTAEEGLSGRITLLVEDIARLDQTPVELKGIDSGTIFFVLHELLYQSELVVVEMLRSYRRLFPGAPLIVFEVIRPTPEMMRRRPGMAIYYTLQHDISHQRLVDSATWRRLFQEAGFERINERYLGFSRVAIFELQ
ncbi:MAG: methyltransferase domain-containing protein [Oscillochloris sp.]|nr:methyltransferase domain-containing protein [Oscillochloris sp.]